MISGGRRFVGIAFIAVAAALGALFSPVSAFSPQSSGSKEPADSVVRLMSAQSAQLMEVDGHKFRKVVGPARFLHNNTYLICDTALWNVDEQVINAIGNVQLLQEETVLSSDRLDYYVERDVAEFRGTLVQMVDKDQNTLRTRYLDYNTKDSLAIFSRGASMKDESGQIIESIDGTYDSKSKVFTFVGQVNMFTDSVFVKSDELIYEADPQTAYFHKGVDAWQDDRMLSADDAIYCRAMEQFSFFGNVHLLSEDQEGWSDTMYVYRSTGDIRMRHEAQLRDCSRSLTGIGDYVDYNDSTSMMTVRERAAIIGEIEEAGKVDTVYFGGDTLRYWTIYASNIPETARKNAAQRLSDLNVDPVAEYRGKAAKAAADAAAQAQAEADEAMGKKAPSDTLSHTEDTAGESVEPRQYFTIHSLIGKIRDWFSARKEHRAEERAARIAARTEGSAAGTEDVPVAEEDAAAGTDGETPGTDSLTVADSLAQGDSTCTDSFIADSLNADHLSEVLSQEEDETSGDPDMPADSLSVNADTTKVQPFDSTRIGFTSAVGHVKVFRKNMQIVCDSLYYTDLDSLTRLFKDPIIWNEGNHQYRADSLSLVLQGGRLRKASLMSNAFVIIQEDTATFDQIKGVEMMAYFDTSGTMTRYDVMGGASALFYLQENDAWATANKAESKMLSVDFVDGEIDRVFYYDSPHNDAYPVVQLPSEMKRMKGFSWQPELRPRGPWDITTIDLKESQREEYLSRPKTDFSQSARFFPGYMDSVYRHIAERDSMKVVNKARRDSLAAARRAFVADSVAFARMDSLARADSLSLADSLAKVDSLYLADSLKAVSLKVAADSLAAADSVSLSDSIRNAAAETARMDSLSVADPQKYAREKKTAQRDSRKKAAAEARDARQKVRQEAQAARVAAREARWEELDRKDAEKIALKEQKMLAKKRLRTARELDRLERQSNRDEAKLERYVERYRRHAATLPIPLPLSDTLSTKYGAGALDEDETVEIDEESLRSNFSE